MPDSKPETARVPMVVVPVELLRRCLSVAKDARSTESIRGAICQTPWHDRLIADLQDALAAH